MYLPLTDITSRLLPEGRLEEEGKRGGPERRPNGVGLSLTKRKGKLLTGS